MKLRLKLDQLRVEAFTTATAARGRGTVHARQNTFHSGCVSVGGGCPPQTADDSCEMTCDTCELGCTLMGTCTLPVC